MEKKIDDLVTKLRILENSVLIKKGSNGLISFKKGYDPELDEDEGVSNIITHTSDIAKQVLLIDVPDPHYVTLEMIMPNWEAMVMLNRKGYITNVEYNVDSMGVIIHTKKGKLIVHRPLCFCSCK